MASGSTIVIAEVKLQQRQIIWRVRSGSGYLSCGGQHRGNAGVLALDGWEDPGEALVVEAERGISAAVMELRRMAAELDAVAALPLG